MATRSSGRSTTRKTRMSRKMPGGKHAHRAAWVVGTGVTAAAIIAAVLLLKNKSANAAPQINPPGPTTTYTPLQQAAVDMNNAIASNGYVATDSYAGGAYQTFQAAAGLKVDGYPGTNTYKALLAALASIVPPVTPSSNLNPAYTFSAAGGWNGTTAPTTTQWWGSATAPAGGWPAMGTTSTPAA